MLLLVRLICERKAAALWQSRWRPQKENLPPDEWNVPLSQSRANMQALATVVAALIVASVAPLIGLFAYFRQREYELVRKKYLEDGVVVGQFVIVILGWV